MTTCRFQHLAYGRVYIIEARGLTLCQNCGENMASVVDGKRIIYRGHFGNKDWFDYETPFQCVCGKWCESHSENCLTLDVTEEFSKLLDKKT